MKLIQPYLFFGGRCEEALEFYRTTLGAEIQMLMRYKESPEPPPPGMLPEGFEEKIMHATFTLGSSVLMASDGHDADGPTFDGFNLSINVASSEEAERIFAALADGGTVRMPLEKTFWAPLFGMVEDRFGMGWMISLEH